MKFKFLPLITAIVPLLGIAQGEMTLGLMEHVYQSTYVNPAAMPDHKVSIGLPGISSVAPQYVNSSFNLINGIEKRGNETVFNLDKFIGSFGAANYFYLGTGIDLFHLRIKWRNAYVMLGSGTQVDMYFSYPRDLFQLVTLDWADANGNGRTLDFSNLDFRVLGYSYHSIGINKIFKNINVAARLKLLQGHAALVGVSNNARLAFDNTRDEVRLENSFGLYSSNIQSENGFNAADYAGLGNLGFGGDFAVSYRFRSKWTFNLSAVNIGFINWKNNLNNYSLQANPERGAFTGVDALKPLIQGDGFSTSIQDTLLNYFSGDTNTNTFRTWLVPRTYLSAKFEPAHRLAITGMLRFEYYKILRYAAMLGLQYKIGRFFSLTGSGIYDNKTFIVGTGVMFKPGPFQFYTVIDNALVTFYNVSNADNALFSAPVPLPLDMKNINIRLGMNIVFGRVLGHQKQSFDFKNK